MNNLNGNLKVLLLLLLMGMAWLFYIFHNMDIKPLPKYGRDTEININSYIQKENTDGRVQM